MQNISSLLNQQTPYQIQYNNIDPEVLEAYQRYKKEQKKTKKKKRAKSHALVVDWENLNWNLPKKTHKKKKKSALKKTTKIKIKPEKQKKPLKKKKPKQKVEVQDELFHDDIFEKE